MPETPVPARRSRSMEWEMVSKAALRSRRMRMVRRPESAARRRLLVILIKAVSGEAGLEWFKETVIVQVVLEVGGCCLF